jgi:long-chain acyl-CoA synthetase
MTEPVGFQEVAQRYPGRVALVDPDGTSMTFGDLAESVNQISHALRGAGLVAGDRVVTVTPNSGLYHQLRLASAQVGLYFTPISHHLTTGEVAYILRDSDARLIIAHAALLDVVGPAVADSEIPKDSRIIVGGARAGWQEMDIWVGAYPSTMPADLTAGDYLGYTSGTTGQPKAVRKPLSGRPPGLSAFTQTQMGRLGILPEAGTHLVCGPLYHAAPGTISTVALQLGHTVVIAERPRPYEILALVQQHRVTTLFTVPTVLRRLLRLPADIRNSADISSLTSIVHAGAPCPRDVKRQLVDWLGPIVNEFYGTTEGTATTVTSQEWLDRPGTVGKPLPGITVAILDDEGQEVPVGEVGQIYFTPPVAFEYLNAPGKTAAAMHGSLFSAGDMGYVDDGGCLYLSDRRTDMILSGGVNVYPAEVEAALLSHPAVADVAVIGLPDDDWGQRLVAVVAAEESHRAGPALATRLEAHCRERLAGFKVPRLFCFDVELARTSAGKLSRHLVREVFMDPVSGAGARRSIVSTSEQVTDA